MNKKSRINDKVYQETFKKFRDRNGIIAPIYATKVLCGYSLLEDDDSIRSTVMDMFSDTASQRVKIGYVSAIKLDDGTLQFSTSICSPTDYFSENSHIRQFDSKYGKFLAMTKALNGNGQHNHAFKDSRVIIKGSGVYYFDKGKTTFDQYNQFVSRSQRYFFPETCPVVSDEGTVKKIV